MDGSMFVNSGCGRLAACTVFASVRQPSPTHSARRYPAWETVQKKQSLIAETAVAIISSRFRPRPEPPNVTA